MVYVQMHSHLLSSEGGRDADLLFPQSIGSRSKLPELDRAVLTSSGVKLAIWGEADRPNGTVMALICL
jgi:hypothetical protein